MLSIMYPADRATIGSCLRISFFTLLLFLFKLAINSIFSFASLMFYFEYAPILLFKISIENFAELIILFLSLSLNFLSIIDR